MRLDIPELEGTERPLPRPRATGHGSADPPGRMPSARWRRPKTQDPDRHAPVLRRGRTVEGPASSARRRATEPRHPRKKTPSPP